VRWAVVLAAGRGTRLQRPDETVVLTAAQAAAADQGLKVLVPLAGHLYLEYGLHALAEAGYRDVCLVVRDPDDPVARAVRALDLGRLRVAFGYQTRPTGTADAVLAAEEAVGDEPFVVLNGDNLYPVEALVALRELDGPGLIGFDPEALVERSNIPAERIAAFALLGERDGWLTEIVEKPDPETARALRGAPVSMTCWRFGATIFDACRDVEPSERGERELPHAVALALRRGARIRVVPLEAGVLDLSVRGDIPGLEERLAGEIPRP
jgi:dTDP-glucose pyrophosphorylase